MAETKRKPRRNMKNKKKWTRERIFQSDTSIAYSLLGLPM
jgi:hypothetical protein